MKKKVKRKTNLSNFFFHSIFFPVSISKSLIYSIQSMTEEVVSEKPAQDLEFAYVCDKLERAAAHSNAQDQVNVVFDQDLQGRLTGRHQYPSVYPLVKFMFPEENSRTFQMQHESLAKLYVKAIGIMKARAQRLIKYANPEFNPGPSLGDFGRTLEEVLIIELPVEAVSRNKVTLGQMDEYLSRLAAANADEKRDLFRWELTVLLSPRQHKWLARHMLRDMTLKWSVPKVLRIYGMDVDDVKQLLNRAHDVRHWCTVLAAAATGDTPVPGLKLLTPFSPGESDKKDNEEAIVQALGKRPFYMERKNDGDRWQVHKKGQVVKLYSRNHNDARRAYYDALEETLLNQIHVEECILDGEIVAWNQTHRRHEPWGTIGSVAVHGQETKCNLMYIVFDVLFVGGKGHAEALAKAHMSDVAPDRVWSSPLWKRRQLLFAILEPEPTRLEIVEYKSVKDREPGMALRALKEYFEAAVRKRWEGLVVKAVDEAYTFGSSSSNAWFKLKPEYEARVLDNMDMVVLGASYTSKGNLIEYLLGVEEDGRFYPTSKVGTGLNRESQEELKTSLAKHWIEGGRDRKIPDWIVRGGVEADYVPDKWILPSNSCLLEIRCSEITHSSAYPSGVALRFPRILRVRRDKPVSQALTFAQLLRMPMQNMPAHMEMRSTKEKQARPVKLRPAPVVASANHPLEIYGKSPETEGIFQGMVFSVRGRDNRTKVETLLHKHGATVLAGLVRESPSSSSSFRKFRQDYVVASSPEMTLEMKAIAKGDLDVVSFRWVQECVRQGTLLPLQVEDYVAMSPSTRRKLDLDEYGDSYTRPVTFDELTRILRRVPRPVAAQGGAR